MKYNIEKGIPIPERAAKGAIAEVLRAMKPGDSFVCTIPEVDNVRASAQNLKVKISARRIDGTNNSRVWLR